MKDLIELQCLNYVLAKKNLSFVNYNNLDDKYFPTFNKEFKYIKNHYDQYGNVPDKETLIQEFPDFEFINVTENDSYLLKELKEAHLYHTLAPDINKIVDLMSTNKTDEAISILINATHKVNLKDDIEPISLIKQAQLRYDEYLNKCDNIATAYVGTGWAELDEVIGGWDRREELAVICAKTGQGKSWAGIKTALNAAKKGLKVGLYAGEMEPNKVGYRLDTFQYNISNYALTHGDLNIQTQYKTYLDNIDKDVSGDIIVITPEMLGGNATVSKLKAFVEKYELDMLCVDQISLMDDERHAKQFYEAFSNIIKDLKTLQTTVHIPIILLAQLNREKNDDGKLSVDNIAGSIDIMRYATTVLLLEQKDKDESRIKRLEITIAKARDARTGAKLTYMWDINMGKLTFVPTENDATNGSHVEDIKEEFGPIGENIF